MGTPKNQAVSTPKQPLSTPSRLMASPRPASASHRAFAGKSPAQGHTHHISVSSQPISTPLAATTIHDDLLALNSPAAALIASLAPTGLTPLASGQDALGITTNLQGTPGGAVASGRDPEAERLHRIQLAAEQLKTRVAGRGITREGVERIAQLQGFNTLWDDDNLSIAGNAIDLEVIFDTGNRDHVRDVVLKLNISNSEEPQRQEEGTKVLKGNLAEVGSDTTLWKGLEEFEVNLKYLSQLDHIEPSTSCFDAVGGLYHTFRKIWDEEKRRMPWRTPQHHLSHGNIGRPSLNGRPKLGLSLDYWVEKHDHRLKRPDGQARGDDGDQPDADDAGVWTARISCEPGPPAVVPAREWLSERIFTSEPVSGNILDTENEQPRPDWRDPTLAIMSESQAVKDEATTMAVEKPPTSVPRPVNMHFVCHLKPGVYLPVNVAAGLNVEMAMVEIHQSRAVTYQQALQKLLSQDSGGGEGALGRRWLRYLPIPDPHDHGKLRRHSYTLHPAQHGAPLWCYLVQDLKFVHPRQVAAALPVLRQYIFLWSILRSLVEHPSAAKETHDAVPVPVQNTATVSQRTNKVTRRSNAKVAPQKADSLFHSSGLGGESTALPVDLSLDVLSDPSKARLDIFIPSEDKDAVHKRNPFILLSLDVCPGGKLGLRALEGVRSKDSERFKSKIGKVLTLAQDVGIVVEWILEQLRDDG